MDQVLRQLDFDALGQGAHKIAHDAFFADSDAVLLDVRTREETESVRFPLAGQVSGSLAIPLHELPNRVGEVPRDRLVGLLCATDVRSGMAYVYLHAHGYDKVRILPGGTAGLLAHLGTGSVRQRLTAKE